MEEQWNEVQAELEGRRIDHALKVAQLELVEEDLALLRANRKVGGTAESLLVEDLEEMADWMHEALRDLLFRRVELKAEIEKGSAELDALEQASRDLAPRKGFNWWVDTPRFWEAVTRMHPVVAARVPCVMYFLTGRVGRGGISWENTSRRAP